MANRMVTRPMASRGLEKYEVIFGTNYVENGFRYRLGYNRAPIV